MAYETRLQGVSGDKISGGWHPWPIFAPLPTSINYIYTRCLKLTPDSPIHFTPIPLYPSIRPNAPSNIRCMPITIRIPRRNRVLWFRYRVDSPAPRFILFIFPSFLSNVLPTFHRIVSTIYILFSIFSRRCFIFARLFLKETRPVQKTMPM